MEAEIRKLVVGSVIVFVDSVMGQHNALVTAVWGESTSDSQPCCNLVFTSGDDSKTDPYGRQIERQTSINHRDQTYAPGFYWKWPDEEATPYKEATAK